MKRVGVKMIKKNCRKNGEFHRRMTCEQTIRMKIIPGIPGDNSVQIKQSKKTFQAKSCAGSYLKMTLVHTEWLTHNYPTLRRMENLYVIYVQSNFTLIEEKI